MSRSLIAVLSTLVLSPLAGGHAAASSVAPLLAAGMVRTYFGAVQRQDLEALASLTCGVATSRTHELLDSLQREATKRHVGLDLRVERLSVAPLATRGSVTPVSVRFDVAVIAKTWIFRKVARQLTGKATFFVGGDPALGDRGGAKILGIDYCFDR